MSEKLLAAGSVTLMAAGSLLGASAAHAATAADCGTHPDATVSLINGTICDVVFDEVGEHSFQAPAGVTAFEAVLIGGGAGSQKETNQDDPSVLVKRYGYAGSVAHYTYEDVTQEIDVEVGAGGTYQHMETIGGIETFPVEGTDGLGSSLYDDTVDGESWREYENGYEESGDTLSDAARDDNGDLNPLFPAVDDEPVMAFSGWVYASLSDVRTQTYGSGGYVVGTTFTDGESGAVIIRWSLPADLAATGVDASAIGIGAGALLAGGVALGAVAAVRRARVKN
jgi:hypothetical protein